MNKTKNIITTKPIKKQEIKSDFFDNFIENNKFKIILLLVSLAIIYIFKDFILLSKVYLFKDIASDSINGFFPFLSHYKDYLKNNSFSGWSFNIGMGQSIVNIYSAQSDISYFISPFVNKSSLPFIIVYTEILKLLLTTCFFFLYFKNLKLSAYSIIIGSLVLPFSAFFIIGSNWQIFSSQVVLLAMLLYALEKLYINKGLWFFPLVIFFIAITQVFSLYVFGVFIFIYILFKYLTIEQKFNLKNLTLIYIKIFALSILGISLSSFFTFNVIHELINGPRVGGESGFFKALSSASVFSLNSYTPYDASIPYMHLKTVILRFFSGDIMGTGIEFKGWNNYLEAPMSYIGLITLILFPQVFQFLSKKQKIVYASLLSFWSLLYIFPYFRYAFWLFTGDYYRIFSLFVSFFLLLFALTALTKIEMLQKFNIKTLFITLIILLILLFLPYFPKGYDVINKNIQHSVAFFLITYSILLFLFKTKYKEMSKIIIFILVFVEVVSFANTSINKRDFFNRITGLKDNAIVSKREINHRIGYNDYTNEAVSFIKKRDKSFFRTNKDYSSGLAIHSSMNDAMVQNYYGTQSYSSFNQKYYINFLTGFNIIDAKNENQTRWAQGLVTRQILQTLCNSKYYITKNAIGSNNFLNTTYDSLCQFEDVKVLENRYFIPLGYCFNKFIEKEDFKKLSNSNKDFTSLQALVIDEKECPDYKKIVKTFQQFQLKDTINVSEYTWEKYFSDIYNLKQDTLKLTFHSNNEIKGNIEVKSDKLLFFSIPFDKGWKAKIDNKLVDINIVDYGLIGLYVEKGKHNIELIYTSPWLKTGKISSIIGLFLFLLLIGFTFWKSKKRLNN